MSKKPASKDRSVKIGDKTLTLVWGFRSSLALQDLWGCATDEELFERIKNPKAKLSDFVDILWAALRTHHADMDRDAVVNLLDEAGADGVAAAVQQAITAAMPPADAKKKPETATSKTAPR